MRYVGHQRLAYVTGQRQRSRHLGLQAGIVRELLDEERHVGRFKGEVGVRIEELQSVEHLLARRGGQDHRKTLFKCGPTRGRQRRILRRRGLGEFRFRRGAAAVRLLGLFPPALPHRDDPGCLRVGGRLVVGRDNRIDHHRAQAVDRPDLHLAFRGRLEQGHRGRYGGLADVLAILVDIGGDRRGESFVPLGAGQRLFLGIGQRFLLGIGQGIGQQLLELRDPQGAEEGEPAGRFRIRSGVGLGEFAQLGDQPLFIERQEEGRPGESVPNSR